MKNQIFTLMLGTAICSAHAAFAMDSRPSDEYGYEKKTTRAPQANKIDPSKLHFVDIHSKSSFSLDDCKLLFPMNYQQGYGYIATSKGIYEFESFTQYSAVRAYLGTELVKEGETNFADQPMKKLLAIDVMPKNKIIEEDKVTFIYGGGALLIPNRAYGYMDSPENKTVDLIEKKIIFTKL